MDPLQWYILLVALGFFLFGLELFVPGGILGVIGGILLFIALVMGFSVFGAQGGFTSAGALVLGVTVFSFLLLQYLPKSPIGRLFTLKSDLKNASAAEPGLNELMGRRGSAETDLRPSGIVLFDQQRTDVVADGDWISRGAAVKVIEVEGNRVVVSEITS
jgi:membrane-bound serine protease (ClpP class)